MWGHYLTGDTQRYYYLLKSKQISNFCLWLCFLPKKIAAYFLLYSTKLFSIARNFGHLSEISGFGLKLFIVYEDNIIYLSNDTTFFRLLNFFGVCLEISSMCPEIEIVHKDCVIFYHMTLKFSRLLKVPCLSPEIHAMCLKIFWFVQTSGECLEISSMCLETLIVQKYYICFLSYEWHNKPPEWFPACVWKFWACSTTTKDLCRANYL